ncbi:IS1380 family transposase [Sanguibacter antarcticus]|uniref:IS4 family transposase n=1 Tax=Sanguibacter antarcticus TaxID=372484 RepID=A0A2A9E463_9MICO|nr:IS1380 family transposase [Sanguibacter antarcticus]PFG33032.1 IS4 family transposase [Sanguibacter antarcticus]
MKSTGYPRLRVSSSATAAVGQAGGVLLTETVRATGLDRTLSTGLARWRKATAVHDPGKVVADLAIALALGGDALADVAVLRGESGLYGSVASDPTVSRTIAALAADAPAALRAIDTARAAARARAWHLAGGHAPDHDASVGNPLVIDLDATLVTAHSEKENAAPTFKRGFGFHPLAAFVDHGAAGTGEPLAIMLRKGNAGSNTAADHITVVRDALAQLPGHHGRTRGSKKILIRTDGAGGTKALLEWLTPQRLAYSVGFTLPENTPDLLARIPERVWAPALDAHDQVRDGAWVAELTDLMDLTAWPAGMRVIVRKERPHPGAQLRFEDVDGMRITAFVTNTPAGQLADLELRHRRRARCEDRIRIAKDTGLRNLPLKAFAQNQIWCAIVALAGDLLAWMGMLALTDHQARRWEPKRLRLRLFTIPAVIARTGRRTWLRLNQRAPWASLTAQAITTLRARAAPT